MATATLEVDVDLSKVHDALRLVEILRPQPNDVIVLRTDGAVSPGTIDRMRAAWNAATQLPNRVVVLSGVDVRIVRPDSP